MVINQSSVQSRESSICREEAQEDAKTEWRGGPPTRYANPAGQGGGCIPKRFHLTLEVE